MSRDGASFGTVLRRLRGRRTQREVADAVGTSHTHLSRLERGGEREVSRSLLERLGNELGAPTELAAAAGRVTPRVESVVAQYPEALSEELLERATAPSLRRIVASERAERVLKSVPGGALVRNRIDPTVICRHLGYTVSVERTGQSAVEVRGSKLLITEPTEPEDPAWLPRTRFLTAHGVAHLVAMNEDSREDVCTYPRLTRKEFEAVDLAACLLTPRSLLERTFDLAAQQLTVEPLEPSEDGEVAWSYASGALVARVAERLAVPGWVAVRRLADEALLDHHATFYWTGDSNE
ncbi:helix-turn-helix domain-containing protein [Cellulosimicrobium sp. SJTW-1]|uniref:helix-turn-helix domain-containing protein n=1 Tax=Cellulosimicrobium sp. SJTW-1 TaxID=3078082 RepID=UPI0039ED3217